MRWSGTRVKKISFSYDTLLFLFQLMILTLFLFQLMIRYLALLISENYLYLIFIMGLLL